MRYTLILFQFICCLIATGVYATTSTNGTLHIKTDTPDAALFIDGKEHGKCNENGEITVELTPGTHSLRMEKLSEDGHFLMNGEFTVEIAAEEYKSMHFVLRREPTAAYEEWLKNQDNDTQNTKLIKLKDWLENGFIEIQPGCFQMGDNQHEVDEQPQHEVCLDGFAIGATEVTIEKWRLVASLRNTVDLPKDYPVSNVSWLKVQTFIEQFNQLIKKEQLGNWIVRLPTEAEWEYAARAGTTTQYSFGDNPILLDKYAWFRDNTEFGSGPHQVAQKLPNPWGLYDMHGNVYEWVQDWFSPYSADKQTNPQGSEQGQVRIIRGGDYGGDVGYARSAKRMVGLPEAQGRHVGFRLVIVPSD